MAGSKLITTAPRKQIAIAVMRGQRIFSFMKITAKIRLNGTPICPTIDSADRLFASANDSAPSDMNSAPAMNPVSRISRIRPGSQRMNGRHTMVATT